jgi:electron transfer flavoprotein alpha subunit
MKIIKDKCKGCNLCVKSCPSHGIVVVDKIASFTDNCTYCGICISSCPFDAIIKIEKERLDLSAYKGIYVFAEKGQFDLQAVSIELLSIAKDLSKDLECEVTSIVFNPSENDINQLKTYGSDKIIAIFADLDKDNLLQQAIILSDLVKNNMPEIFLIGATADGRSLAPRVAAKLNTGLTADCTELSIFDGILVQTRPAYGGNLMAQIVCPNTRPQMATVRPGVFRAIKYEQPCEVINLNYEVDKNTGIKVLDRSFVKNEAELENSEVIIGAGRGVNSKESLDLLFELADALGGTVAASRPLVDANWLEYDRQIGQTGKTVSPRLYIACGISGAIQHMAGVGGAETIVAINSDPDAPIFNFADYAIVGEVSEILPEILSQIKKDN